MLFTNNIQQYPTMAGCQGKISEMFNDKHADSMSLNAWYWHVHMYIWHCMPIYIYITYIMYIPVHCIIYIYITCAQCIKYVYNNIHMCVCVCVRVSGYRVIQLSYTICLADRLASSQTVAKSANGGSRSEHTGPRLFASKIGLNILGCKDVLLKFIETLPSRTSWLIWPLLPTIIWRVSWKLKCGICRMLFAPQHTPTMCQHSTRSLQERSMSICLSLHASHSVSACGCDELTGTG